MTAAARRGLDRGGAAGGPTNRPQRRITEIRLHHGYPAPKSKKANPEELAQVLESVGAGDRSRTYDLRITNALLYQLSYTG